MAFAQPIGGVLSGVLKAVGLLSTPGKPPAALPSVTRDDAAAQTAMNDELSRRKGAASDILNGSAGTEATLTGGKLTLGS